MANKRKAKNRKQAKRQAKEREIKNNLRLDAVAKIGIAEEPDDKFSMRRARDFIKKGTKLNNKNVNSDCSITIEPSDKEEGDQPTISVIFLRIRNERRCGTFQTKLLYSQHNMDLMLDIIAHDSYDYMLERMKEETKVIEL